jgi:hypothetical protein
MKVFLSYLFSIFNFGSDISAGIIITYLFSYLFGLEFSFGIILFSILCCMLPDIDMLLELPLIILKKIRPNKIHQAYTHFPLLYVIFIPPVYFYGGLEFSLIFVMGILWHFIHDSFGTSWGIAWLYPFKGNYYKFFSDKRGTISSNFIQSWLPNERKNNILRYGDDNWMINLYINSWLKDSYIFSKPLHSKNEWLKKSYSKAKWFFRFEIVLT